MKKEKIKESKVQSKIIKLLEDDGYFVIKTIITNKNGIPDVIWFKDWWAIFIEVKAPWWRLSKIQMKQINTLRDHGMIAFALDDPSLLFQKIKEMKWTKERYYLPTLDF